MRWTERQRAMLREMGIRLWEREPVVADGEGLQQDATVEVATPQRPASAPVAAERAVSEPVPVPATPTPPTSPIEARDTLLPAADWLFVGEPLDGGAAPGAETQLLDNMLRAIGVARDGATRRQRATYLALPERTAAAASAADPDRRERLRRAVDIVQPACIVALGRTAAQALLGSDEPLGSLRGRRHEHAGAPVFVTCPLAFLLRHPDDKAKAWADLCLAVGVVDAALAAADTAS